MPNQCLLVRNDYERKINYDWPKWLWVTILLDEHFNEFSHAGKAIIFP